MTDLAFLTATELGPLIRTKQVSPVELTNHILKRIDKMNPTLNAYITPLNEFAIQQAKEVEDHIMRGNYKGPLHGIPIGIKDNYNTKDIPTTAGAKIFKESMPNYSASSVTRLLEAGGIMLGKLNMHQLGAGLTGINPSFGSTRNPWNNDYIAGGSSSGSGASLAAGLATLTTGTDTFGSIRFPAAMNGIYGLKPTYGLISTYGVIPAAWSLDHAGPMARSVSDLALMLNYMAGYDSHDPASLNISSTDYSQEINKGIKGIKIGIPTYYLEGLDPEVEKLFKQAVSTLQALGAEIKEIQIPELNMSTFAGYSIVSGEAAAYNYNLLQESSEEFEQDARVLLLAGTFTNAPKYLRAQQARRKLSKGFEKAFQSVDILVCPTMPITTPAFNKNWVEQNLDVIKLGLPFTVPANLAGIPSLSVPMGIDSNGLPTGMQLMGNHLSEKLLFQVGHAWESTNPLKIKLEDINN